MLVPSISREGQAVGVALEERAVAHRVVGETAFFRRAEIRDVLAWLRLLADPTDAAAVVRALARPPVDRSVDIARCTQIARRRKLDMVGALAAAMESPQVPPEARERIRALSRLYRAAMSEIDSTRPDMYVHRLIDRLGLRRQQLLAAQADVVQRLRALARFGELASAYARRSPQATAREFARHIAAVADFGLREHEEPDLSGRRWSRSWRWTAPARSRPSTCTCWGSTSGCRHRSSSRFRWSRNRTTVARRSPGWTAGAPRSREVLYVAVSRARRRVVLAYPSANDRSAALAPAPLVETMRRAVAGVWEEREEEMFGPAETLHSTYRLLRDEVLEGTMAPAAGSPSYGSTPTSTCRMPSSGTWLLKLAALIERPEGQSLAEAVRDVNSRILQAVTAEQREIFTSSALDDYLLDAERDARRRAAAVVARDDPSVEAFLPTRGDGVVLSASDIDTYRTCPLKYKFARVFRIPQEPTIHQRFGIVVHQVLERFHALGERRGLRVAGRDAGAARHELAARWVRRVRGGAPATRQSRFGVDALPRPLPVLRVRTVWFERAFSFKLGPHLLRGRVDRVDRLPGGEYELIDYKTGRPKSAVQLVDDVQLSLYAVGAREAWRLDSSQQAYYYVLDDQKVAVPDDRDDRFGWIEDVAMEVAEGILSQGFEPTPSFAACSMCDYRLVCPAAEG